MASLPRSRAELRRLHFINALFAEVTGHDLYLAQQIERAIAFSLAELAEQTAANPDFAAQDDAAFNTAAAHLLAKLLGDRPTRGFFHWDAALTPASATPLFARAELMAGLKKLARYREATLLVTNLRPALVPRRATARRQRDYEEALAFIRTLTAAKTRQSANLQLLFL